MGLITNNKPIALVLETPHSTWLVANNNNNNNIGRRSLKVENIWYCCVDCKHIGLHTAPLIHLPSSAVRWAGLRVELSMHVFPHCKISSEAIGVSSSHSSTALGLTTGGGSPGPQELGDHELSQLGGPGSPKHVHGPSSCMVHQNSRIRCIDALCDYVERYKQRTTQQIGTQIIIFGGIDSILWSAHDHLRVIAKDRVFPSHIWGGSRLKPPPKYAGCAFDLPGKYMNHYTNRKRWCLSAYVG